MLRFPPDFRFGVADADLQVVGEDDPRAEEDSLPTMWDAFARGRGLTPPGAGVGRYHRFADDIALMRSLGVTHYRTSVSMSRLLTASGDVNAKAVAWYRRYFGLLREGGVRVYATLYHWELPQFLAERGGWANRETVDWFVRHAGHAVRELGDLIDEYYLVNEPWCVTMLGHYRGLHAPGERDLRSALLAAHHVLLAVGLGLRAVHDIAPDAQVGTVFNAEAYTAASANPDDVRARDLADGHFNRWFMDPIYMGRYPDDMVEAYRDHLPNFRDDDLAAMRVGDRLHAFGLNYYSGVVVRHDPASPLGYATADPPGRLTNDLGWPVAVPPAYPDGLLDVLTQIWHSYRAHGLRRIDVTENGFAQAEPHDDARRIFYLREHLRQVHAAIRRGVPVAAYFAWTLLDNYEWQEGYRPEARFGLVHVDRATLARTPKASAAWFTQVVAARGLEAPPS
ncbi:MAG: family 1 glycosylhydrolase [Gemmataceae bacterium]